MNADAKVAWMRENGVLQAQWSVDGDLMMCVLGPPVVKTDPKDAGKEPANDEPSIEELLLMSA